jgi:Protein of unknown function (DUF3618)
MTANQPARKAEQPAGQADRPAKGPRAAAAADIPDDPQELVEDIKQTRAQVGETVAALTAKLDPKTQLRETRDRVKERVSATTGEVASKVTGKTGEVTSKVTDRAGTVGQQLRGAAAKAARGADERRVPLAVAGGVAVLLAGAWIAWAMRRR